MSIKQNLFVGAITAAINIPADASAHEAQTKSLESFNAAQHNPLDYPIWESEFNQARQKLGYYATQKAMSELVAAEKPAAK